MSIGELLRDEDDFDEQDLRIGKILGNPDVQASGKTLKKYFEYLKTNLTKPCELTGMEDFDWEEPYVLGGWSKSEYEKLKKTQPSYTDKFDLIQVLNPDDCDDDSYGLFTKVIRISDKRQFTIPLCDLETTDKKSKNHQLLDDYSCWYVNNR